MRAAFLREGHMIVDHVPAPVAGPGEVLVKTLACGICGSDLHAVRHGDRLVDGARRSGLPIAWDLAKDVVMGHEFVAEIVEHGPDTSGWLAEGTRVCSMPLLIGPSGIQAVGYSNDSPGGYGELMRLSEMLLLEVPNGLATASAALTEPMAVGVHAVEMARLDSGDVPLVVGCGPVGLAVIAALGLKGIHPIVAADFSPRRRDLAALMGADVVVDPALRSPYTSWSEAAVWSDPATAPMAMPWMPGPPLRPQVVFECVGSPGMIQQIALAARSHARVVVVGVCMEMDQFEPMLGINKELSLQFVLGYSPSEFAETLRHLADGDIDAGRLITGTVGVEGVPGAFDELASPERHAKILVEPWRA